MIEVEIKVKIDNKDEIIEKLKKFGFKFIKKKFQEDIYFNGIDRDFRKTDEALRIRDDDGTFFITYKGPKLDNISKTREEIEVKIEDKEKMRLILKKLGFKEVLPIRKIREIYKKGDIIASIDNVEGLGLFLELEKSISDSEITKKDEILNELLDLLKSLNISKDKIIRKSYLELRGEYGKI
ncbi:Adenylate cyclase [Methanocaldococcus lauensis]|uniref:Adenylate cyclase n=1 Tax=Methanocaldococcus lauensis TaxID=2546128 RepID=A0A8D6PQ58_9EURY|nr:class IV adenylate cyclase [Methanocaldococcus lauensis]CAB3287961.1 Adenylate cyclase [Methanocaldococcus lauensis]